jgi:signal transduction histidine kinase
MDNQIIGASAPVNILLVDDQPAKLLSYEVILDGLGDNLIKAGSAREALEHLLKKEIAVILIDVCMPELDGFELAAMIRSHPRFQRMAIIFVSAIAMTDLDRVKGYEHGAVDYVPVPVVPELLRARVRIFVELYRKTRQLEALNAELERRVAERTAELAQANAVLEQRVEERTREREIALAQVHEMQKLESLGQLTGGLAHDFNNLLMAAMGNLDLLAKRLPSDPVARRLIDGALQSAERGAALTSRMLAFARRQELTPEIVDVARLVGSMAEMLQRSLGPAIRIGMDFDRDVALIRADRNQLELAILNLALNARDAMPDGGRLSLTARRERVGVGAQGLRAGDYLCVSVADTGCGMDEATLKRAAEPFFTTKGIGKGTGLGLSMVYGLAAQSGGGTRISSRIGNGTTVELLFPIIESDKLAVAGAPPERTTAACRPCLVLVVDDDSMVAESTAAMLDDLGHTVLVASSAVSAMERIRADPAIDLVITDHAMPGMTGVELARQIRQTRPQLPIILATGYADLPGGDDLGLPRLAKPYRQADLKSLVAKLQAQKPDTNVVPIASGRRA